MRLPELDFFGQFLVLETENLPNLGIFEQNIEKFCDFRLKYGLVELKHSPLLPDISITLFKVSTPSRVLIQSKFVIISLTCRPASAKQ